jgi:hypothetical protein
VYHIVLTLVNYLWVIKMNFKSLKKLSKKLFGTSLGIGALIAINISVPIIGIQNSTASSDWEYRDGIYGEFKYIKVCNRGWGSTINYIAEVGSGDRHIKSRVIDVKINALYSTKHSVFWTPWTYQTNYTWKQVKNHSNTKSGDRRWYSGDFKFPSAWFGSEESMKFSIHVLRKGNGIQDYTIDLGKIKDLGVLQNNKCRVWNDGVLSDGN